MAIEIGLSRGSELVAIIDDADAGLVCQRKWHVSRAKSGLLYAATGLDGSTVLLHRYLLRPPSEKLVDHVDGDGLNNRRSNLRICSHAENIRNQRKRAGTTSSFKGVHFHHGRWQAEIEQDGERLCLGSFDTERAAALQYDRAARLAFGRFARTNEMAGLLQRVTIPPPRAAPPSP